MSFIATARYLSALVGLMALLSSQLHADKLDAAVEFLESVGIPTPPGYEVGWGETGGAPARTRPSEGTINVSPDGITNLAPGLDSLPGSPEDYGGVLVVVLYHEYKHADGSYQDPHNQPCQEVQLVHHTAIKNCELICHILEAIPDADVTPLCTFYKDVQDGYNNGSDGGGGASAVSEAQGCSDPYPGDIPDCDCCDC